MNEELSFHHIGILTTSLSGTRTLYVSKFDYIEDVPGTNIAALGIRACSLCRQGSPRVELIEPIDPESPIGRRARQSAGGYHLAWLVPSLETVVRDFETGGFHPLPAFQSPLWSNANCQFMIGPDQQLVEFIERPANQPATGALS